MPGAFSSIEMMLRYAAHVASLIGPSGKCNRDVLKPLLCLPHNTIHSYHLFPLTPVSSRPFVFNTDYRVVERNNFIYNRPTVVFEPYRYCHKRLLGRQITSRPVPRRATITQHPMALAPYNKPCPALGLRKATHWACLVLVLQVVKDAA